MIGRWAQRRWIAWVLLAAWVVAGCGPTVEDDPERDWMAARSAERKEALAGVHFVQIRVMVVELPFSNRAVENVWGMVDESLLTAKESGSLSANGMRAGLGTAESWPEVAAELKRLAGRQITEALAINNANQPITLAVKERQPAATVFAVHADQTISGLDFPAGEYLLALMCAFDPDDPSEMHLACQPQVRGRRRQVGTGAPGDGALLSNQYRVVGLDMMTFQTRMAQGQFLLVGPGHRAERATSIGHRFFIKDKGGMPVATLLVLFPEVVKM